MISATTEPWPPDYLGLFAWRQRQLYRFRSEPYSLDGAKEFYRTNPIAFICDWVDTFDPRNAGKPGKITRMPFVLFQRQRDLIVFLLLLLEGEADGLVEKCRDAGVTWICVAFSVWLWLFWPGIAIGWGSRKEQLVDKFGVIDSIFEKIRLVIRGLPKMFLPVGFSEDKHFNYMRIINPENGATIVGEAGDKIGRGGRFRIFFLDEAAHVERPESIEAALGDATRVLVAISSVNGFGNVFHRKREAGLDWNGGPVDPEFTNVAVFDWRHHPEKTEEWYWSRRRKAEREGMLHLFAQEVDRDYSASVEGVIIPQIWVQAAIDAHVKLGLEEDGGWMAGLDVADEGLDKNALSIRRGIVLRHSESWAKGDVGDTARRAVQIAAGRRISFQYDCVGIGAGVKAEANRLKREQILDKGIHFQPWNAGSKVLFPDEHVIRGDDESPLNRDYYANLKAQGWWELRGRFSRTYQAVIEGIDHDPETLISIDSGLPELHTLTKELSQATSSLSASTMKLVVNKSPDGTRSPNLADSVVMAYWPVITTRYTLENVG